MKWLAMPLRDFSSAMEASLAEGGFLSVFAILLSAVLSWWVYVPIHELLHALGCVMAGGKVERLDISGIYGASILRKIFPFVSVGSEYSGRLTGFDTRGSDFAFFITDFMPYVLTVFLGVPLLKSISSLKSSPTCKSIFFGLAAPFAYAPFMSVFGDYYEMGSILVSRPAAALSGAAPDRWRSDDLFRLLHNLSQSQAGFHSLDAVAVIFSLLIGTALIFATYWAGALCYRVLFRRENQ
ncbi:MAG: hypothetical protein P8Z71_05740 [Candidatus Sulfobium sp.]